MKNYEKLAQLLMQLRGEGSSEASHREGEWSRQFRIIRCIERAFPGDRVVILTLYKEACGETPEGFGLRLQQLIMKYREELGEARSPSACAARKHQAWREVMSPIVGAVVMFIALAVEESQQKSIAQLAPLYVPIFLVLSLVSWIGFAKVFAITGDDDNQIKRYFCRELTGVPIIAMSSAPAMEKLSASPEEGAMTPRAPLQSAGVFPLPVSQSDQPNSGLELQTA